MLRWRDERMTSNWRGRREKKRKQSSECVSGSGRHDGEREAVDSLQHWQLCPLTSVNHCFHESPSSASADNNTLMCSLLVQSRCRSRELNKRVNEKPRDLQNCTEASEKIWAVASCDFKQTSDFLFFSTGPNRQFGNRCLKKRLVS